MSRVKFKIFLFILSLLFYLTFTSLSLAQNIFLLPLKGPVTPVLEQILEQGLKKASQEKAALVVITLDTPGGLLSSTRNLVQQILNYPLPLVVYVYPQGAHAASAGVFLVASADMAAMAPNTTLGSATPIFLQSEKQNSILQKKVEEDALSLLKSLCLKNKRNFEFYKSFITEATSIEAGEAVLNKVVDFLAVSVEDLLEQIKQRKPRLKGQEINISNNYNLIPYRPSPLLSFLSYILHPQIAYLLFLGGLLGLFFELSHPGTIFPGVVGSLALVLGLYALSLLPINLAGILLILLGIVFFILELKITSYGLLSVAGLIALFLGSYFFYEPTNSFFIWSIKSFLPGFLTLSFFLVLLVFLLTRSLLKKPHNPIPLHSEGEVISWQKGQGQIKVRGEIWQAQSTEPLQKGQKVKVVGHKGLTLNITPLKEDEK